MFVTEKSSHSDSLPEDSGSLYKSPLLGLKTGLWGFRKSQKISTASDQYFLSYEKTTTGGGVNWHPPSRNRVLKEIKLNFLNITIIEQSMLLIVGQIIYPLSVGQIMLGQMISGTNAV